jgi:hypothetical protein
MPHGAQMLHGPPQEAQMPHGAQMLHGPPQEAQMPHGAAQALPAGGSLCPQLKQI